MEWKLVAPDIDRLLGCFDRGYKNPTAQTRKVLGALDRLFEVLADLVPLATSNEAKSIWLKIPRGSLDDFDSYEDLLGEGEVGSREEYIALWESEYPDAYTWYEPRHREERVLPSGIGRQVVRRLRRSRSGAC